MCTGPENITYHRFREYEVKNFVHLPTGGRRTQFFHHIFTQPMESNNFGPSTRVVRKLLAGMGGKLRTSQSETVAVNSTAVGQYLSISFRRGEYSGNIGTPQGASSALRMFPQESASVQGISRRLSPGCVKLGDQVAFCLLYLLQTGKS